MNKFFLYLLAVFFCLVAASLVFSGIYGMFLGLSGDYWPGWLVAAGMLGLVVTGIYALSVSDIK